MIHPSAASSALDEFLRHRSLLFGVAYRLMGRVSEAEDLVQEAWLRWQQADHVEVRAPKSWLVSVITRMGIDRLRSASREREQYYGLWLPEPLLEDTAPPGNSSAEKSEALGMAFLVMIQALTPEQRAVFLLREVFDFDYEEIARMLGKSEANCRQLLRRAKQQIKPDLADVDSGSAQPQALAERFVEATKAGNVTAMLALLDHDAVLYSDGGGKVRAAGRPITTPDRIARFFEGVRRHRSPRALYILTQINRQPGVVTIEEGTIHHAMILDTTAEKIRALYMIRNPDKLQHLARALPKLSSHEHAN